jgi:hypothetical protein
MAVGWSAVFLAPMLGVGARGHSGRYLPNGFPRRSVGTRSKTGFKVPLAYRVTKPTPEGAWGLTGETGPRANKQ